MNKFDGRSPTILMVDDDDDDFFFFAEGIRENRIDCDFRRVTDGRELMDYLLLKGRFTDPQEAPRPLFVLLDLNMPHMSGHDALRRIKSIPELRPIPIIVYSSSRDKEDVTRSYALGANSHIGKPACWDDLVRIVRNLFSYWTSQGFTPRVS